MEERRMRTENAPQSLMGEQMNAALHLSHPYGRPVVGWMEELRHIDRASASDFYRRHYAPNNAILVVAGDVTAEDVRVMAQKEYGGLPARPLAQRAENAHPPRLTESRLRITRDDAKVPVFSRTYRVPSYATAQPGRAEALETMAQALGGDQTSLLYRVLVEQRKLATEVGASYDGYRRDMGEFSLYAVPRPGVTLENLERALDEVLATAARTAPTGPDLDRAKTQLIAAVTFRRDSQYQMASAYGQALTIGLTVDDVNAWPQRIRAVSANAVRSAAAGLNRAESVTGFLLPGGGK
jgi:zinc protease